MTEDSNNPDVIILAQAFELNWKAQGVEVRYTLRLHENTSPFDAVALVDRLTYTIREMVGDAAFDTLKYSEEPQHKATCDKCGRVESVKFKPNPNRPFLCNDCYARKKGN